MHGRTENRAKWGKGESGNTAARGGVLAVPRGATKRQIIMVTTMSIITKSRWLQVIESAYPPCNSSNI